LAVLREVFNVEKIEVARWIPRLLFLNLNPIRNPFTCRLMRAA
jgi:hypothetical protein